MAGTGAGVGLSLEDLGLSCWSTGGRGGVTSFLGEGTDGVVLLLVDRCGGGRGVQ